MTEAPVLSVSRFFLSSRRKIPVNTRPCPVDVTVGGLHHWPPLLEKSEEEKEMEGVWEMMEKPCVECAIIRGLMEEENMLTCATFVHVVFDPVMLLVLTDDQLVSVNHYRTNVGR